MLSYEVLEIGLAETEILTMLLHAVIWKIFACNKPMPRVHDWVIELIDEWNSVGMKF